MASSTSVPKSFEKISLEFIFQHFELIIVRQWNLIVFDQTGPTISEIVLGKKNEVKIDGNKNDFSDNVDKKFQ